MKRARGFAVDALKARPTRIYSAKVFRVRDGAHNPLIPPVFPGARRLYLPIWFSFGRSLDGWTELETWHFWFHCGRWSYGVRLVLEGWRRLL